MLGGFVKMKTLFCLLLISISGYYFFSAAPDSRLGQIKVSVLDSIGSIGKSKVDYEEEVRNKTAELEAYEKGRSQMEADFVKMEADLPTCPITGQKSVFTTKPQVPAEVIERIDKLKAEIAVLKTKTK